MILNLSKDNEYFTQVNNWEYPFEACMPTSYAMAATYAGCLWDCPAGIQPEDYFMDFLRSDEAVEYANKFYPSLVSQGYCPNEIHGVLPWAFAHIGGRGTASFKTNYTIQELVFNLVQGNGVVISGVFPYKDKTINHVVVLAGVKTYQANIAQVKTMNQVSVSDIEGLYIDDPFGDYHTRYTSHRGNDVYMEKSEFLSMIKRPNAMVKWGHIIRGIG